MNTYFAHDQDGRIVMKFIGSSPIESELNGCSFLPGDCDSSAQYVQGGELIDRPVFNLGVGPKSFSIMGSFVVTGIPEGAVLHHPDGATEINDGSFEWDVTIPGRYTLRLELFPYITEVFELEVTNA